MLIRQIRSLGSPGKKTGEQADLEVGSLRLFQDTHLIFRGSNFSLERQGGLLFFIVSLIKGFMRSESIRLIKNSSIERYAEREVCYTERIPALKEVISRTLFADVRPFLEPFSF